MSSYYDWADRARITKAQRDQLWRDLKSAERGEPRPLDVVNPAGIPPMSDPTVTATRAALDANALGMTVEEIALPEPDWRDHEPNTAWETAK